MPRSPRDRSGPAQPVTISLSPRHRKRLAEMAAEARTSKGVVVERLIDGGIKPVEPGASFKLTPGGRGDPRLKAAVDALKRGNEAKYSGPVFPEPKEMGEAMDRHPVSSEVAFPKEPTYIETLGKSKLDPKAHVEPRLKKGGAK